MEQHNHEANEERHTLSVDDAEAIHEKLEDFLSGVEDDHEPDNYQALCDADERLSDYADNEGETEGLTAEQAAVVADWLGGQPRTTNADEMSVNDRLVAELRRVAGQHVPAPDAPDAA